MIEPWLRVATVLKGDYEIFRVRRDVRRSPRTGQEHPFHLIEAPDWVNIVPVTREGRLVMVEQYRHGTDRITLEIPGGVMDASDDSPHAAARREMIEETGFDSDQIEYLGVVAPNPAVQTNQCYSFLARNVREVELQTLDHAEDIIVRLIDRDDVPGLIEDGLISHALVVAAFYLLERHMKR